MSTENTLGNDVLIGAAQIAGYIFDSKEYRFQRRVYYLTTAAKCKIPHFRIGQQLAARKSTLREWIEGQEDYKGR
jgi:hypothetical protein